MKKILLAALFATVAGALVFGAAASLTVNSNDLGSGSDDVVSCDTDGVDVTYILDVSDSAVVETVKVDNLDGVACEGQLMYLTVTDGEEPPTVNYSAASTPILSTDTFLDFDVNLLAEDIEDVAVTITD